jgi:hypothetical protein
MVLDRERDDGERDISGGGLGSQQFNQGRRRSVPDLGVLRQEHVVVPVGESVLEAGKERDERDNDQDRGERDGQGSFFRIGGSGFLFIFVDILVLLLLAFLRLHGFQVYSKPRSKSSDPWGQISTFYMHPVPSLPLQHTFCVLNHLLPTVPAFVVGVDGPHHNQHSLG